MTDPWAQPQQQQYPSPQQPGYAPQGQPAPGWGQPAQQGFAPQGPPPGFQGQPQGQPQQQAAAWQPEVSPEDFFKENGGMGGGVGGPSFKWDNVIGAGILGVVVDQKVIPKTTPGYGGAAPTQKYDKNGRPIAQLAIVLQTDLRNWQGVSKIPKISTPQGEVQAPPEQDTGLRVIYGYYTLRDAIEKACQAAGVQFVQPGWELGARVVRTEGEGQNTLRHYEAVHRPPTGAVQSPFTVTYGGAAVTPVPFPGPNQVQPSQPQPAQQQQFAPAPQAPQAPPPQQQWAQQPQAAPTPQVQAGPQQQAPVAPPAPQGPPVQQAQPGGPADPWAVPQGQPGAEPGPAF